MSNKKLREGSAKQAINIATENSTKKGGWSGLGIYEKFGMLGLGFVLIFGLMSITGLGETIINTLWYESSVSANDRNSSKKDSSLLSSINPFTNPSPTPTPQLSKEYIYAGGRLLSVVDANVTEVPPADLAVWRENGTPTFYALRSSDSTLHIQAYGIADDVPAVADYNGDGKADFSVRRGVSWYVMKSSDSGTLSYTWGVSTDQEVPNDYDGDGKADIAVWRESNGT